MSLSTLLYIAIGYGLYALGHLNGRDPGKARELCVRSAARLWRWFNQ